MKSRILIMMAALALALTSCKDTEDYKAEYASAKQELTKIGQEYGSDSPEWIEQNEEVSRLWPAAFPDKAVKKELYIAKEKHPVDKGLAYLSGLFVTIAFVVITKKYSGNGMNFLQRITFFINPAKVFSGKTAMKSDWVVRIGAFVAFTIAYAQCINLVVKAISYPSLHSFGLFVMVSLATMTASIGFTKVAG